jgi:aminoglycoside 3'-phosphotransferase-1
MDLNREQTCGVVSAPLEISAMLTGYEWLCNTVGESGGTVYRLRSKEGASDFYLKYGRDAVADEISTEMERLNWLARYMTVPAVVHFTRTPDEAWLLMTAVPGTTAYQVLQAHPDYQLALVDAIARFLRQLHAIPVNECPFNSGHAYRLSCARARIDAGLVDEGDFDEERDGWTAEQIWEAMQRLLPLTPDPVVTHGDFSLDNLLIKDGEVIGCIDTGRVGIADRYQDLAILLNCLTEFDAALQERFLKQYGIDEPDQDKLQFHLLLDELF